MRDTSRRTTIALASALAAGALLGGCSARSADNASSSGAAPRAAAGGAGEAAGTAQDTTAEAPDLSVDQRSIIYTGSITLRVDDVNQAAAKATGIVAAAGGFVGADKRNDTDGSADATLELRVPAEKFASVVDRLARTLGTEEQRSIDTQDVTEQVVDLDARIGVQQARVDSGRRLLSQAKTLADLVMLEKEVASRESDLASLQAKKRRLADLTALSTITVVLVHPKPAVVAGHGPAGFLGGLQRGWDALLASLAVLLTILGALLPWLIAAGIPAAGTVYAIRRFGRRRLPAPGDGT